MSLPEQWDFACPSFENWFAPVGAAGAEARVGAGAAGAAGAAAAGLAGAAAGGAAGAAAGGAAGAAAGAAVSPARHFSTYAFSVIPAAWFAARFARHSSVQAFTVFCWASAGIAAIHNAEHITTTNVVLMFASSIFSKHCRARRPTANAQRCTSMMAL